MNKVYEKALNFDKKKEVKKSKEDIKKDAKKKEDLVNKIFLILGVGKNFRDVEISFDTLTNTNTIKKLYNLQDELKKVFPSDKLTSLQKPALSKQEFPGVNLVRQILKELGYTLKPIVRSNGYLGKKKIVKRSYLITPLKS